MNKLPVGTPIIFTTPHDDYPSQLVVQGWTGIVVDNDPQGNDEGEEIDYGIFLCHVREDNDNFNVDHTFAGVWAWQIAELVPCATAAE